MMTSQTPLLHLPRWVMNCVRFDICTPSSFGGVKTDRQAPTQSCAYNLGYRNSDIVVSLLHDSSRNNICDTKYLCYIYVH